LESTFARVYHTEVLFYQIPRAGSRTVTVCIPTYNRARLLRECIGSVLAQTFEDFDLVVADNASEDGTEAVVASFGDDRIQYARAPRNLGAHANWERCLQLARGQFVVLLSDDDLMWPDNLEAKLATLRAHPRVGLVHSKYDVLDEEGRVVHANSTWGHGPEREVDAVEPGHEVLAAMLLGSNIVNASSVVFRRACYERLHGFTTRLRLAYDWEYWMRIAVYYDIAFLARPLIGWRVHMASQTSQRAHLPDGGLTETAFRDHILAKWIILTQHADAIPEARRLRRQVRNSVIDQIEGYVAAHLVPVHRDPAMAGFALRMGRAFPDVFASPRIWSLVLRGVLSARHVESIRRLWRRRRGMRAGPPEPRSVKSLDRTRQ
jgi:glycosyltransferase involved in cell wall biosynthesis